MLTAWSQLWLRLAISLVPQISLYFDGVDLLFWYWHYKLLLSLRLCKSSFCGSGSHLITVIFIADWLCVLLPGHLTSKGDVYSFGVVLLGMLTGRRSMDEKRPNAKHNLVEWARPPLIARRRLYWLIDPWLEGHFSIKGAQKAAQLAAWLGWDPKARPLMS